MTFLPLEVCKYLPTEYNRTATLCIQMMRLLNFVTAHLSSYCWSAKENLSWQFPTGSSFSRGFKIYAPPPLSSWSKIFGNAQQSYNQDQTVCERKYCTVSWTDNNVLNMAMPWSDIPQKGTLHVIMQSQQCLCGVDNQSGLLLYALHV